MNLCKKSVNLPNFISPNIKLHNPYYHSPCESVVAFILEDWLCTYIVELNKSIWFLWYGPLHFYKVHVADIVEFAFCHHIRRRSALAVRCRAFHSLRRLPTFQCVPVTGVHMKCVFGCRLQVGPQICRPPYQTHWLVHASLKIKKKYIVPVIKGHYEASH